MSWLNFKIPSKSKSAVGASGSAIAPLDEQADTLVEADARVDAEAVVEAETSVVTINEPVDKGLCLDARIFPFVFANSTCAVC